MRPATFRKLGVFFIGFALAGCGGYYRAMPAPGVEGLIKVTVDGEQLSTTSELPIGAYRVPDSDVIVTGHQRGSAFGAVFGLFGAAIAHAANSNSAAAGVSNTENMLRIKLADQTQAEIARAIGQSPLSRKFTTGPGLGRLEISSALLLCYTGDTQIRPFVVLKVHLRSEAGHALWETRYFASTGEARPMAGADGWTSNGGGLLRADIERNLRLAVQVMLHDVAQPFIRNDEQMTVVEGSFPYHEQRLRVRGYRLAEKDNYIAFVPKLPDGRPIAGVHLLSLATTTQRPARQDD